MNMQNLLVNKMSRVILRFVTCDLAVNSVPGIPCVTQPHSDHIHSFGQQWRYENHIHVFDGF